MIRQALALSPQILLACCTSGTVTCYGKFSYITCLVLLQAADVPLDKMTADNLMPEMKEREGTMMNFTKISRFAFSSLL